MARSGSSLSCGSAPPARIETGTTKDRGIQQLSPPCRCRGLCLALYAPLIETARPGCPPTGMKQLVARGSQAGGGGVLFFYVQSALAWGPDSEEGPSLTQQLATRPRARPCRLGSRSAHSGRRNPTSPPAHPEAATSKSRSRRVQLLSYRRSRALSFGDDWTWSNRPPRCCQAGSEGEFQVNGCLCIPESVAVTTQRGSFGDTIARAHMLSSGAAFELPTCSIHQAGDPQRCRTLPTPRHRGRSGNRVT